MVVVGDAAVTRLYKDGIGAAFTTAEAAARTAIELGVSQEDFAAGFRPACRRLALDNIYGRMIFTLWNILRNSPTLMNAWQQAVLRESRKQVHRRALWGMFTGDELYRHIFWASLSRTGLGEMWRGAMASWRKK
jgi:flavin-dependent dehydrogenase